MKIFKKFKNQILLVLSTIAAVSTQYTGSQIGIIISVAIQAYVLCNACKLLDKSFQCDLSEEMKKEV